MSLKLTPEVREVLDELGEAQTGLNLVGELIAEAKKDVDYLAFMNKGRLEGEVAANAQKRLAQAIAMVG
jgi:hypothetical protein